MRLKEIESSLSQINIDEFRLLVTKESFEYRDLNNINNFKLFLDTISTIDVYQEEIEFFRNSILYETTQNKINLKSKKALDIYHKAKYLSDSTNALKIVFHKLLPQSSDNSISIKLPEPADLEALNKTMNTVQKYISQLIVNDTINGTIKVNHWEFGSFWIELAVGTPGAVTLISSAVWAAAVISKKFNENKILEQQIRSMSIKNESLEDILESQKKLTSQLIDNEAQNVLDKHFEKDNFEQFERIKGTIKTFAKLIQDGAEIHPALMAPEKVQNLFPNYKKLDMVTSKIKQIEDKLEH